MAMDEEPFELGDFRDNAQRIGELLGFGQNGMNRPPGELAMADLAPARRAHAAGFADRIGREIIMQQEVFLIGAFQRVDPLLVFAGAERRHAKRLGFAAGKERRAVGAGHNADFADDRADGLQIAPVDALAGLQNTAAHDGFLERLEGAPDFGGNCRSAVFRHQLLGNLGLDLGDLLLPLGLAGDLIGFLQLLLGDLLNLAFNLARFLLFDVPRILGGVLGEADDRVDHRLKAFMAEHHGPEHDLLGQLLRLRFDHQHGVGRAGDDEFERAGLDLVDGRDSAHIGRRYSQPWPRRSGP